MTFVISKNPTRAQFHRLTSGPEPDLKGLISGDNIYMWAAWHAHHHQIAHALGLENPIRIFIRSHDAIIVHPAYNEEILNNPHVQYLFPQGVKLVSE